MKKIIALLPLCLVIFSSLGQTNITVTNPTADAVLHGNYNPSAYSPTINITNPDSIVSIINAGVSTDSLYAYLLKLSTFENRNTGSDTLSATTGIGAARTWVYNMFEKYSTQHENRLITSYLQFDLTVCSMNRHKNTFTVLPGSDTTEKSIIIIEGHMDSRCENVCDINCSAHGMEDNGSGTALVMELARVMGQFQFEHTIVFMATTGEEQGLHGAEAFSNYCVDEGIEVKAVLNNDVIGGIICGKTSSPPSCLNENDIDSTQVRIFSRGGFDSRNKQLARFVKLEYEEELKPIVNVPMLISIMSAEDRTGRGGDHIPFREDGFTAIRFTSANEHGDASNSTGYEDRQHTVNDILGMDTNNDSIIDSFFVDFNYLSRNACINGTAAAMAGNGPKTPDFSVSSLSLNLMIEITDQTQYDVYRVAIRTTTNDWDSVYTINGINDTLLLDSTYNYIVSVASVDDDGVESLFSREEFIYVEEDETAINYPMEQLKAVELLQNKPNPFDEATIIGLYIEDASKYVSGQVVITDMKGSVVESLNFSPKNGMNEVLYDHGYNKTGSFFYTLFLDNHPIQTKKMVFAN